MIHPTIDGCIQLRNEHGLTADQIEGIELQVHPLVLQLTGKKTPQTGLEGKFSVYHAAAAATIDGAGGVQQFSDESVRNPVTVSLRDRVAAVVDPDIHEDQAGIAITLKDGRRLEKFIEHAIGSVENPMTDADLEAKFIGLADGVLPSDQVRQLLDLCWNIETLPSAALIAEGAIRA